jgi:hypothetical protein
MDQLTFNFPEDSTFSQAEHPARTSQWQDSAKVAQKEAERAQASCGNGCDWLPNFVRELSSGKMSSGVFPRTTDETSHSSWQPLANSGMAWRGEFWTANTPEWTSGPWPSRRGADVCGLSDVLMPNHPTLRKYYLSPEALSGILRRADARGKKLPELLKVAIHSMLAWWKGQLPLKGMVKDQAIVDLASMPMEHSSH